MSDWYRNGERVTAVPVGDRGLQYGDGLFETVAIRGGRPRLWTLHLDRLVRGCRQLEIELAEPENLHDQLLDALRQAGADSARCVAKILVTAEDSGRGYGRPGNTPGNVTIGVFDSTPLDRVVYRDGVATIVCRTRLATPSATAGLKTLNRLEQVLSAGEARDAGAFEGLNLDADGHLICGTMSNVFIVRNQRIITPALGRCGVAGVMRRHVLETLAQAGTGVEIADLAASTLQDADEVFLTNSQFGVVPIARCGELAWGGFTVTQQVMRQIAAAGIEEGAG